MTVDALITETADRLFGRLCTHDAVQAAEEGGGAPEIWEAFTETGFAWISLPEEAGGSGGTLEDALEVLRLAGYHAAPIPAAENGILGGWLLASAGLELPEGIVTVAPGTARDTLKVADDGTVTGSVEMVPWGRGAERLAVVCGGVVASIPVEAAVVETKMSLAGEPRDTLTFDGAPADVVDAPVGVDSRALRFRGALSRVALMGGAIEKMSQLTVSYTNEREQFGRPVARFQAVQQHLVWAAQDAALARMAAEAAGAAASRGEAGFEIAAAKLNTNQAATRATKACHQAHGAMGMTQEYPLHHYSRRLWSWRTEYGGTTEWAKWVGEAVAAQGADGLYPAITGGSAALI
ncbi:MAG: acyl-CoA dehydrogenase [Actinomycetia bacterium]|nr:acyl-CoA dehydrogenase [Actinomycetes bacterium]MCP4959850.1 acyl-CoA dehydrogenase [Actinomycetes bacterium]